ncbi:MAG: OmpA family protein [Pseudomonadota bacterium]|nr:OmpA family protein [Pseudomonadota bacterium]
MHSRRGAFAITVLLASLAGCQTTNPYTGEKEINNTSKGAGIGAAGGAIIGAIAGGGKGAAIGAGAGALAGGGVGYYMDKQADKLRRQLRGTGVSVTRSGDNIILNMPGNITFATDSADVSADFYPVLDSVGVVLNEYDKTDIQVLGFTDSTGSESHNQQLSERRAGSVAGYLKTREVSPQRLAARGMGESRPVATNDTPQGRAQNRRVEIHLTPAQG